MAIIKQIDIKGYYPEYWMIRRRLWSKTEGKTTFWIVVYRNRATRLVNKQDYFKESERSLTLEGEKTTQEGYLAFMQDPFFANGANGDE